MQILLVPLILGGMILIYFVINRICETVEQILSVKYGYKPIIEKLKRILGEEEDE